MRQSSQSSDGLSPVLGLSCMVDSSLLSGLGFGCVGLASAQTLVSPRRLWAHRTTGFEGMF